MKKTLQNLKKSIRRKVFILSTHLQKEKFPKINKMGLSILMEGHPYIHNDEITLFADMASKTSGPIVEIGCAFGASPSIFLLHSKDGVKLHSIDPFVQDSMRPFQANEEICKKNVLNILKVFKKENKYKDWTLHTDYSFNVVKNWKEEIEIIFIDGDHTYDAVKKDFEDWYPLVKKSGYILFHDSRKEKDTPPDTFNRGWAGPTKLVEELKSSNKVTLVNEAFSVTVWQKN